MTTIPDGTPSDDFDDIGPEARPHQQHRSTTMKWRTDPDDDPIIDDDDGTPGIYTDDWD